jgi:16S rRNA (adenine1518-N6/adenine1519-N6)-dimethyltransferase
MEHIARKRFGQHFLTDKQIIQRIIDAIAPTPEQKIVEIGPGQGAITRPLLKKTGKLIAIELDRDLIPQLKHRCEDAGELTIHQADALEFDFKELIDNNETLRLVGNLPYNISTPLIFHLLTYAKHISDMHFMLQKEVVDRMAAMPATSDYGRLSIMVQYHCKVTALFHVPPQAFNPPPKVDSSIVRIIPYRELPHRANNYKHFAHLVKTAFSQRRKTLRNCLKLIVTDADWEKIHINSQLRPEQLSVSEYVKMSNMLTDAEHGNVRNR